MEVSCLNNCFRHCLNHQLKKKEMENCDAYEDVFPLLGSGLSSAILLFYVEEEVWEEPNELEACIFQIGGTDRQAQLCRRGAVSSRMAG